MMKERLPGFLLAHLFPDSIVDVGDKINSPKPETNNPQQKTYLGNYEKKIVVLVNDAGNMYLSDDDLNFLSGILTACKLNLAHIALLNCNTKPVNFEYLKKELNPSYLLSFGITALQIELPFAMPDYQLQDYNKCKILTAPSLNELNRPTPSAKEEKSKLWKSLKKMFDIE